MTINQEIELLKSKIQELSNKIIEMAQNDINKTPVPYSKVGFDRYLGNQDVIFDADSGQFKTYAIYKDEPED